MKLLVGKSVSAALVLVAALARPSTASAQEPAAVPRAIWHLTEPSRERLRQIVAPKIAEAREGLRRLKEQYPNLSPDEVDWRNDFGCFEIAADPTRDDGKMVITELVFKHPEGTEIGIGITGDSDNPDWDGTLKVGFAWDKWVEFKVGGRIDVWMTADEIYDGEWQKPSEWTILRGAEDFLAKFDFYVGGAAGVGVPGGQANTGIEVSWGLRDRLWNKIAFQQMYDALDNLADAQAYEAEWRKRKIEEEAKRVGVDPKGKSANDLIKAIHEKYDANPGLRKNIFKKNPGAITVSGKVSDWYCTNRPWISVALSLPNLIQTGLSDFFKNLPAPPDPPPAPPDDKPIPK